MAPVAARLAMGLDPDRLGPPLERLMTLDWPVPAKKPVRIDGAVIEIDSFGNLITNITAEMLAGRPTDRRACIVCNIYETWGIYHAYAEQAQRDIGGPDRLGRSAGVGHRRRQRRRRLGISVGTPVTLAWEGEEE